MCILYIYIYIEIKHVNDFLKCNKNNLKTNLLLLKTKNYKVHLPFQRASITSQSSSRTNSLARWLKTTFSIPKSNSNLITTPRGKLSHSFCTQKRSHVFLLFPLTGLQVSLHALFSWWMWITCSSVPSVLREPVLLFPFTHFPSPGNLSFSAFSTQVVCDKARSRLCLRAPGHIPIWSSNSNPAFFKERKKEKRLFKHQLSWP